MVPPSSGPNEPGSDGEGCTTIAARDSAGRRIATRRGVERSAHSPWRQQLGVRRGSAFRPASSRVTWRGLVVRGLGAAIVLAALGGALLAVAISTDAFGMGARWDHLLARVDRLVAGPPPDRATVDTVVETPPPSILPATASPASLAPGQTATPAPTRHPVDVDIDPAPAKHFASEERDTWCAPAGVQMALAVLGLADTSSGFQERLAHRIGEWESTRDSKNGDWGPGAMALALAAYGAPGYQVRAYGSRADALRDAAAAISTTHEPAILLAWRGAHTWVMTGYRATADPTVFGDAKVTGAYILDPWYPRISSIWGPSDPPGTFQDQSEMVRNYLPWQRPEGLYAGRDGRFIAVVPTLPAP
jgi:hypothetical protein